MQRPFVLDGDGKSGAFLWCRMYSAESELRTAEWDARGPRSRFLEENMRRIGMAAAMALVLAGCNQTTTGATPAASAGGKAAARAGHQKAAADGKDACAKAMQAQTNAAMLGGALGMVGGLGGFAGRGGAVAGHVASTAGGMIANQSAADMQECY